MCRCVAVNESTKVKGGGSIGKKGIGFKSVFTVTSRPTIHSNVFHLFFDSEDPEMRFVLPRPAPVPLAWMTDSESPDGRHPPGSLLELPYGDFPAPKGSLSGKHGSVLR